MAKAGKRGFGFNPFLIVLLVVLVLLIVLFALARIVFWIALAVVIVLVGIWLFKYLTKPKDEKVTHGEVTYGEKVFKY